MVSCIANIASLIRFEKLVPNDVTDKKTRKKTDIIVIGNAKEKRLRVGADLVITPIETCIKRSTTAKGSIITAAALHIKLAASIPAVNIVSGSGKVPIGKKS
tara:strand:+ start:389 stop:694 length:306 start_codon:yes stop_codon:yes gene_type:complete